MSAILATEKVPQDYFSGQANLEHNQSGGLRDILNRMKDGILSAGAPVAVLNYIPEGTPGSGVATTWAEVDAFAEAAQVPWTLFVDSSAGAEVPSDADTDFKGLATVQLLNNIPSPTLVVKDGGVIRNFNTIARGAIQCEAITAPGIVMDIANATVIIDRGGIIGNAAVSLVPAMEVRAEAFVLVSLLAGQLTQSAAVPIVEYTISGFYAIPQVLNTNGGNPTWPDDSFLMAAGSFAISVHDGTATLGSHSGIPSVIDLPVENSNFIGWQSGVTGSRPTPYVVGQPFFDTTLGHPIWWNGSNWVDATGSTV